MEQQSFGRGDEKARIAKAVINGDKNDEGDENLTSFMLLLL